MEGIRGLTTTADRLANSALERFMPEPKSTLGLTFQGALKGALGAVSDIGSGAFAGIDSGYAALLNAQIEAQKQMQLVSMESNIEKSRHETQMAAIRNVRVG